MGYISTIKTAIFIFPIIALLFTIPFILHQYHKYGSINKLRVLIIYSFILYMITIYFLVILPLPDKDDVVFKEGMIRLIPFTFISDFLRETSFVLSNPHTYLKALKEPCVYTVVFNVFMTVPFGMYLKYYYKCDLKKTIVYTLLLSLFFEVTQLTGLYYIYKYPYRIFDVDDLIINTLGGVLGYYIMGLIDKFLPTRDEIDNKAIEAGKTVSGLRRITTFFLDLFIFMFITILISILYPDRKVMYIILIIYYILIPYISDGTTIGSKFLNVKLEYPNYKLPRNIFRLLFINIYYFILPYLSTFIIITAVSYSNLSTFIRLLLLLLCLCGLLIFYLVNIIIILAKRKIFYDRIFKVEYKSTIRGVENE